MSADGGEHMKRWTSFMWDANAWHDPSTAEAVFCGVLLVLGILAVIFL